MKPRSGKNKGQRLQKAVVEKLRDVIDLDLNEINCFEGDIQARLMGGSGTDIVMSPLAKTKIPFDIECKNTEKLNIWGALKQSEENTADKRIPLVVFKRNRSKTYAVLELEHLLELLYGTNK